MKWSWRHSRVRQSMKWGGFIIVLLLLALALVNVFVWLRIDVGKRSITADNGAVNIRSHSWSDDPAFVVDAQHGFYISWVLNLWPIREDDDVVIPIWLPVFLIGLPTAFLFWRDWKNRPRSREHLCGQCGYNLTGNVSGVCPECGTPVPGWQETARYSQSTRRKLRFLGYLLVEVCSAAGAALCFIAAYTYWVQVQARSEVLGGHPADMVHMYGPALGCVAFVWGLVRLFRQDRNQPPLNRKVVRCLLIGVAAPLISSLWPELWR